MGRDQWGVRGRGRREVNGTTHVSEESKDEEEEGEAFC